MDRDMSVEEHLGELRRRIIWVLATFVIMLALGLWLAKGAFDYLQSIPPAADLPLHAFSPWSGVRVYMQFGFILAAAGTMPVVLYQVWAFFKEGLLEREREATIRYIPLSILLFLVGLAFAYFVVFKMALYFTTTVNRKMMLEETYGITEYFSFMLNILLPVSLLFELPVVIMFLTRLRIVTPRRLQRMRKYAYFALVFIGTVITPPDLISDLIVAIPLIVLYEISVFLSGAVDRKIRASEARGSLAR
ncbi:twin-arginine translocase subunit TatC [Cohnella terricola]|uniref:Sec-independent protein translocase protein TatC n=2 Tax=Cohnella terricola TaxID=1289167 RepID=A0A559JU18_9BACL|nr:twin-arginine translocase subunit TatC [Cohnella terricola]